MTIKLFGYHLTFNFRSGVGFDIEFCDSRPIWVTGEQFFGLTALAFMGVVILIPFCMITYGKAYELEEF
jgi:hypothetical protein|tara:strand:- start:384 stop:590 length:207 start_codon:yes stop_codon:yes gene_type:complete